MKKHGFQFKSRGIISFFFLQEMNLGKKLTWNKIRRERVQIYFILFGLKKHGFQFQSRGIIYFTFLPKMDLGKKLNWKEILRERVQIYFILFGMKRNLLTRIKKPSILSLSLATHTHIYIYIYNIICTNDKRPFASYRSIS